ncbi:hypothetical protein NLI96_g4292 [Meripilus lineatus]|uniref:Methyltransferase domain-containing protein n=1 Tax=Meripilus lineatus TaxID=2056292 RepID=A0AAD5V4X8_9APHY|nr:hypothetical protein NLI96_g4292 [Physisporinus lineatus]
MGGAIRPEIMLHPSLILPLDETLLTVSQEEVQFLHRAITPDDDELLQRIVEVQKAAYEKYPYPCIRAFHFVNLMMSANAIYPEIIEAGKSRGTIFLDLGCFMGTDVRKLVMDGYPAQNVLGADLRQAFIDLGYQLYQDTTANPIRFFTSDIFTVHPHPSPPGLAQNTEINTKCEEISQIANLEQLRGRIDHFYLGALFHLFDEETQYALALRVASLLKRQSGSVIFGRHQGLRSAGLLDDIMKKERYGHSPSSWMLLWQQVFTEIESKEFAESKVLVEASFGGEIETRAIPSAEPSLLLFWSVRIL